MMDKIDLELMNEIMDAVIGTEKWEKMQKEDPLILEAWADLRRELGWIESRTSPKYAGELEDMVYSLLSHTSDAAILYGIHVAGVLQAVAADPAILSKHIMERFHGKSAG